MRRTLVSLNALLVLSGVYYLSMSLLSAFLGYRDYSLVVELQTWLALFFGTKATLLYSVTIITTLLVVYLFISWHWLRWLIRLCQRQRE